MLVDYRLYPSQHRFDPALWFDLMKSFLGDPLRQLSETYPDETRCFFENERASVRLIMLQKDGSAYLDIVSRKPFKGFPLKELKKQLNAVSYLVLELSRGSGQCDKSASNKE